MKISKSVNNNEMLLKLEGWLDTESSLELKEAIDGMEEGIESMAFDMEKLEYISSSGVRLIVAAQKKMNGNFKLMNVTESIFNVLDATGITKRVEII